MRRGARALAIGGALLALQGGALLLYRAVESRRDQAGAPDTAAPPLEATRPDGSRVRLADLRGTVVIVHFWATWCPPCRAELPQLLELGAELRAANDAELLAVALDDAWSSVDDFLGAAPRDSVVLDASDAHRAFGVATLPATFVVGPDGNLRIRIEGARDWRDPGARSLLRAATR